MIENISTKLALKVPEKIVLLKYNLDSCLVTCKARIVIRTRMIPQTQDQSLLAETNNTII